MTYGAIHGVPVGARFRNRRSLYDAGVHRDIRRGICGGTNRNLGAESIVLSGGYEDDLDLGQIVYFTGIGKRDARGELIADQEFSGLNGSLAVNALTGQPVRVLRLREGEFEYSGLYVVEDAFSRTGQSGFRICQFRLRAIQPTGDFHGDAWDATPSEARRLLTTHYRLVRDTAVPARIKTLYDYRCQICGIRIATLAGAYSEGAHIVPLGGGAGGPDIESNVLSLCPNHHVMLDHGAITLTDDWRAIDRTGALVGTLEIHPDHHLDPVFARRHRKLMGFQPSLDQGERTRDRR